LVSGAFLLSSNQLYILYMQFDCNLVLYYGKLVIWNTKTNRKGVGCFFQIRKDGNLAVYDKYLNVIWSKS
ncbi:hypothetical protein SELMODRAFT_19242, partial [Selaginella moellendorffii]